MEIQLDETKRALVIEKFRGKIGLTVDENMEFLMEDGELIFLKTSPQCVFCIADSDSDISLLKRKYICANC